MCRRDRGNGGERMRQTREERAAKLHARYLAHREEIAARYAANREERRTYRQSRRDEIAAAGREYYAAHREEILTKARARYIAHREENPNAYARLHGTRMKYAATHREKLRAANRKHYATHRERILAKQSTYEASHRDIANVRNRNRQARKRAAGGVHTVAEWRALCEWFENKCLACGAKGKLSIDHVIPIAIGGTNDISNLQPLCKSCNSKKGIKGTDYRDPVLLSAFLEMIGSS